KHSLAPALHPTALAMVNLTAYGSLSVVDGIMTVSNAVARTLTRFGPPVRLQPNYRRYEEPPEAADLRGRCGIPSDSTVLITTGNVVNGFESVLEALSRLPPHVHLVGLIKLSPEAYGQHIHSYIAELGLESRVHLLGFVPYEELTGLLADADLGIITLDPENPNHAVSLPNRVFDFTAATLPFIVPPLAEIAEFVREHQCGVVLDDVSSDAWLHGIASSLENIP